MIPTHRKGRIFKLDTLFPHFGTVLGLPDYATSELLCEMQVMKKGKRGYYTNADLWSNFKSNNHFSNTSIEIVTRSFEGTHLWFLKIGTVSLGPAALHSQFKKNGMLKPP